MLQLKEFPEGTTLEGMRKAVGRFGITGKAQTQPILQLSDGLRSRLVFAWLAYKTPHILLLVSLQDLTSSFVGLFQAIIRSYWSNTFLGKGG